MNFNRDIVITEIQRQKHFTIWWAIKQDPAAGSQYLNFHPAQLYSHWLLQITGNGNSNVNRKTQQLHCTVQIYSTRVSQTKTPPKTRYLTFLCALLFWGSREDVCHANDLLPANCKSAFLPPAASSKAPTNNQQHFLTPISYMHQYLCR